MIIGGLQKFSLLDYPGRISAIVFTQGCNFRCGFCYNPMLVWPVSKAGKFKNNLVEKQEGHTLIKEDDLFVFLEKRRNKLDAVVITGGEPTLWVDLPQFLDKIKKLGYLIKLDTNGTNPTMIKDLIKKKLIDYIAMDIKIALFKDINYLESIKIVTKFIEDKDGEFRWTLYPGSIEFENKTDKVSELFGSSKVYLQKFIRNIKLNNDNHSTEYKMKELIEFEKESKKTFKTMVARW